MNLLSQTLVSHQAARRFLNCGRFNSPDYHDKASHTLSRKTNQATGNFLYIPTVIFCVKKVKSLQRALIHACHLDQTLHLEVMKNSYASKV